MSKIKRAVSHHDQEVAELRADRELAVAYLKAAMEAIANPDDRSGGLLALRAVAEAYGGLASVAVQAGITREALYRALSPTGNPTLKTLIAVLDAVGMKLSVENVPRRITRRTSTDQRRARNRAKHRQGKPRRAVGSQEPQTRQPTR